jgi:hypothetical protein
MIRAMDICSDPLAFLSQGTNLAVFVPADLGRRAAPHGRPQPRRPGRLAAAAPRYSPGSRARPLTATHVRRAARRSCRLVLPAPNIKLILQVHLSGPEEAPSIAVAHRDR